MQYDSRFVSLLLMFVVDLVISSPPVKGWPHKTGSVPRSLNYSSRIRVFTKDIAEMDACHARGRLLRVSVE